MSKTNMEGFVVYHEGVAIKLKWDTLPSSSAVMRLCAIDNDFLLLLTANESLYKGCFNKNSSTLHLKAERDDILDVDYCQQTRKLFIITNRGVALMQHINTSSAFLSNTWQQLVFDPLEILENGIFVQRVCCSSQGVLFLTQTHEMYVMGNCGDVFTANAQPKHLRLFEEYKEVLDMTAGDTFFVVLLKRLYDEKADSLDLPLSYKKTQMHAGPSLSLNCSPNSQNKVEIDTDDMETSIKLNSNTSLRSTSSSKSNESYSDLDIANNLQNLLKKGYSLLNTEVYTFGAINNGLLGTGDHIKRHSAYKTKLESIGVCSIASGAEHTVARTLDGRLYHWGINSKQQLSANKEVFDLSAPTELKLDNKGFDVEQCNILEACCGDFQTVLLNARGEIQEKEKQFHQNNFIKLQMCGASFKTSQLLLMSKSFTLYNCRIFRQQFHTCLCNLQMQLQTMLKYRGTVQMLLQFQDKNSAMLIKQLQPLCQNYEKILYLLATLLRSFECFYRGDFDNTTELVFIKYYRECIDLFDQYTKIYCDIFSIDGFADARKVSVPPMSNQHEELDLARMFQQPLQIFPNFVQFLEQYSKTCNEYAEQLLAWQSFARQNRIDFELAQNTQDFWHCYERNTKLRHFKRKNRRVILTSTRVPLKLSSSQVNQVISRSTTTFILFSDCLCQTGGQFQTFPLITMWINIENETSLRIITPEKSFTLIARSHLEKMVWYDQLESSIVTALGRSPGTKIPNVRTTVYMFSKNHDKYSNVHAYGRWCNGVLHGNCCLEYPDGKFYFGEMRRGEIEGFGKMVVPSVGFYVGTFKCGKFHGYGTYEMKDSEVYEGNFQDGQFHGHGTVRNSYYTYVGAYQGNAKCGYGILDDMLKGDKYMGMFQNNQRSGPGTCITMNGDYFEGEFINDQLSGSGIAVFENNFYYEGDLTLNGPNGHGTYYMPTVTVQSNDTHIQDMDEFSNGPVIGSKLQGQLGGNWQNVNIISGAMSISTEFSKYPSHLGRFVVDNSRKWCTLFKNFEEEIFGSTAHSTNKTNIDDSVNVTKNVWSCIAVYMTTQREREKTIEQQDAAYQSTHSYFAKNISTGFSSSFDKVSLRSTNSFVSAAGSSTLDLTGASRFHSQETLSDFNTSNFSFGNNDDNSFNNLLNIEFERNTNTSMTNPRSLVDDCMSFYNSSTSRIELEFVPRFGITSLNEDDIDEIKEYLQQAFKDRFHPLHILNQRISDCFYTSYGCWKVKPTAILAKQAMTEWESITIRVYTFVRKLFPALPEDYCILENEVISHITLLYPFILSEGVYSTLFVLYANKYSRKDEVYRQNLIFAEKLKDNELAEILGLESSLVPIVATSYYLNAIQTFKQLQEKNSPKAMLTVIENCMQLITEAYKSMYNETSVLLSGDSMMPLTLFLILRAAVPHLGAELALLDDLTATPHFQFETNGFVGYCYTTLKAAYMHIIMKPLNKT